MNDDQAGLRARLSTLHARLPELAQAHPDTPSFVVRFAAEAAPILRAASDAERDDIARRLYEMAADAGIPYRQARAVLALVAPG